MKLEATADFSRSSNRWLREVLESPTPVTVLMLNVNKGTCRLRIGEKGKFSPVDCEMDVIIEDSLEVKIR
jgi:hypothetical protein